MGKEELNACKRGGGAANPIWALQALGAPEA